MPKHTLLYKHFNAEIIYMAAIMMSPPYFSIEQAYLNGGCINGECIPAPVQGANYACTIPYYTYKYFSVVLSVVV